MKVKVNFLDCRSHGDCTVITFKEGNKKACIVVDGGDVKASAKALTDFLQQEGIKTINLMIGTHIDQDHINGLKHFVNDQVKLKDAGNDYIKIDEYWGPQPSVEHIANVDPQAIPEGGRAGFDITWQDYVVLSVTQNDDLYTALTGLGVTIHHPSLAERPQNPFNNVKIEMLGPDKQIAADSIIGKALGLTTRESDNEGMVIETLEDLENAVDANREQMAIEAKRNANNQSIVFRLSPATGSAEARKWTFLFTGDAEEEAWEGMLADPDVAKLLPSRVLKIPHHGSGLNGITDAGARKVDPDYSVNLVGQKHGLPDADALKRCQACGSKILCTQYNGDEDHPSACLDVPGEECPAWNATSTVTFTVDTQTGNCEITPTGRECGHSWQDE